LPVAVRRAGVFTGAVAALRQRTLDMNVLAAVAIRGQLVYSVAGDRRASGQVFLRRRGDAGDVRAARSLV